MNKPKSSASSRLNSKAPIRRQRLLRITGSTKSEKTHQFPIAVQLVGGLALLIGIGTVLLLIPGVSNQKLSFLDALFTSTSASAATGLSVFPISTGLNIWGQLILLFLVQIGGVGFIVAVVMLFRLIGHQLTLGERLAVTSSLGLDHPEQIAVIMVRAILLMLGIEAVGAVLLFLHWTITGIVSTGKAAFYAFFTL
jgi:trk system potassium uptake protein TrkH